MFTTRWGRSMPSAPSWTPGLEAETRRATVADVEGRADFRTDIAGLEAIAVRMVRGRGRATAGVGCDLWLLEQRDYFWRNPLAMLAFRT